jgi:hypothetical protein
MRIKTISVLLIVLLLVVAAVLGITSYQRTRSGTVAVTINIAQQSAAKVEFNDRPVTPVSRSATSTTYRLAHGSYTVVITDPGYKPFSTQVTIHSGDQLHLSANLQLDSDPTLTQVSQIKDFILPGANIGSVRYFYGMTWAVLTVTLPNTDPAVAVTHYNPATSQWSLVAGPGTFFSPSSLKGVPSQAANYLLSLQY